MPIKKDVVFPNSDTPKHKQVVFDTVNESRLVKPSTTAIIISQIMDISDELLDYELDAKYLIPENVNPEHGIPKYSEENVRASYKLLKQNTSLNFIEALFLLLGLDPYQSALPPFNDFKNENYSPVNDCFSLESIFYVTKQYQALKRSSYLINGRIKSEDLIKLAEECDFFIKKDNRIAKRHLDKDVSKKIYNTLMSHNYITGDYDDMWIWNKGVERNKLAYLAKRLKQKCILGNNCHKELSNYIPDPNPTAKKPLKNLTDISPKAIKIINSIVDEL